MAKSKKSTIDEKLDKLEKAVKKFEGGKVGIDEGIKEYEKASKLIKDIKKELTGREVKIEKIKKKYT